MARGQRLHVVNSKNRPRTDSGLVREANRDPDYLSLYGASKENVNFGGAYTATYLVNALYLLDLTTRDEDNEILEEINRNGKISGERKC